MKGLFSTFLQIDNDHAEVTTMENVSVYFDGSKLGEDLFKSAVADVSTNVANLTKDL